MMVKTTRITRAEMASLAVALVILMAIVAWAPSQAFAASRTDGLAAGTTKAAGASNALSAANVAGGLSAQATKAKKSGKSGKRTVYVITSETISGTIHTSKDDEGQKLTQTKRFTYAKDGLLQKSVLKRSDDKGKTTVKYSYRSKRLVLAVTKNTLSSDSLRRVKYVCSYEKNGRVVNAKIKSTYKDGSSNRATHGRAVYSKSGRLKKLKEVSYTAVRGSMFDYTTGTRTDHVTYLPWTLIYKYKYKGTKIIQERDNGTYVAKSVIDLDKHGNEIRSYGDNTYRNDGLLAQRSFTTSDFWGWNNQIAKYTYRAIKVPASMVAKVKAQQWAILNSNRNGALGVL